MTSTGAETQESPRGVKRDAATAALADTAAPPPPSEGPSASGNGSGDVAAPLSDEEAQRLGRLKARDASRSRRLQKLMATDPKAAERLDYRRRVGICVRDQNVEEAKRLFEDVKERDIDMGPEGYNALLSLANTAEEDALLMEVFTHMRAKGVPLAESGYVTVIKAKALGGQPQEAEQLLQEMLAGKEKPRLRCYSPIIEGYAQHGNADAAFRLYDQLLAQQIEPTEAEFLALLQACNNTAAAAASDPSETEARFLRVLHEMRELVLEPEAATWDAVEAWFRRLGDKSSAGAAAAADDDDDVRIHRPARVDRGGVCSGCGHRLASVDLTAQGKRELMAMVEEIVLQNPQRRGDWEQYKQWLQANAARFDVVVDGANVGYYQMNYAGAPGHVNYDQIDWVVDHFRRQGRTPMLVLHARHVVDSKVPPKYLPMVKAWRAAKILCQVPFGNNDDWFWLYATVAKGGRTLVVTNDQMRDHHFQMLSRRAFLRWRERHQAPYHFLGGGGGGGGGGQEQQQRRPRPVRIEEPTVYSRCIQGPADAATAAEAREEGGRQGEEEEKATAVRRWHFPLADNPTDWLCVQHTRRRRGREA